MTHPRGAQQLRTLGVDVLQVPTDRSRCGFRPVVEVERGGVSVDDVVAQLDERSEPMRSRSLPTASSATGRGRARRGPTSGTPCRGRLSRHLSDGEGPRRSAARHRRLRSPDAALADRHPSHRLLTIERMFLLRVRGNVTPRTLTAPRPTIRFRADAPVDGPPTRHPARVEAADRGD